MSKHSFTAGPWHATPDPQANPDGSEFGDFCIGDCPHLSGRLDNVAVCTGIHDARLIAAAPELLEALKEMVDWHGSRAGESDDLLPTAEQPAEVRAAMSAIAKAEGRA